MKSSLLFAMIVSMLTCTQIVNAVVWQAPDIREGYEPSIMGASKSDFPVTPFDGPHQKALTSPYVGNPDINRSPVPEDKILWSVDNPNYTPTEYTHPKLMGESRPPYAQSERVQEVLEAHELGGIKSFYTISWGGDEMRPLNPMGRTGLSGRGILGHWAANPAVDALLLRENPTTEDDVEIFLIWRRADAIHALPGGMQEKEELTAALKKEVHEEVGPELATLLPAKQKTVIYRGYVDDPRNTDNAWMETTAFALFFNQDEAIKMPTKLSPTDTDEVDQSQNGWFSLNSLRDSETNRIDGKKLYASHAHLVNQLFDPKHQEALSALGMKPSTSHPR
jgi:ADP-ribose pyrophosphatase